MQDYVIIAREPGGSEVLERREITLDPPGAGEVLVRHEAIGLNFLDIYHRSGAYPWATPRDLVPGSEAAGVVERVGPGVSDLRPGDRVGYTHPLGAYASARVIAADRLLKLPDGISTEMAAGMILKGLTAHYLIHDSYPVARGDTVLVHAAAGGVGLLLGQWLRAKGVHAIGTAGGPEKVALAMAHGYDAVIDYRAEDFVARVKELTEGRLVHAVYDSVGADTWRGSLDCLRPHGTFVNFGQASGPITDFAFSDLAKGSFMATRPVLFHFIAHTQDLQRRAGALFAALSDGTLRPEAPNRFALTRAAEAHDALESRATTGTTILIP
ncbi:quinone oxidoreductase [Brevirhabdus pacifica]|uniref:Quinone oxidoreductase n=1 Tax=Brevirhabdus pacifica TaxID=1267768 RepID=A0A1U7DLM2_9RHOB|nr:quinone oxidoreductase [Brevirhabdus pacifica]APX90815.1 quinone oxidoreductase [Brevirhabdus pacifica]OWU79594.1 quinone oxidoreductase [Loktanella sp. 22II-4b]PJJ87298.1 NADPH2:quinone reductase [Brevirhabdus pacifica]